MFIKRAKNRNLGHVKREKVNMIGETEMKERDCREREWGTEGESERGK